MEAIFQIRTLRGDDIVFFDKKELLENIHGKINEEFGKEIISRGMIFSFAGSKFEIKHIEIELDYILDDNYKRLDMTNEVISKAKVTTLILVDYV